VSGSPSSNKPVFDSRTQQQQHQTSGEQQQQQSYIYDSLQCQSESGSKLSLIESEVDVTIDGLSSSVTSIEDDDDDEGGFVRRVPSINSLASSVPTLAQVARYFITSLFFIFGQIFM
jgi:hypothetical protein